MSPAPAPIRPTAGTGLDSCKGRLRAHARPAIRSRHAARVSALSHQWISRERHRRPALCLDAMNGRQGSTGSGAGHAIEPCLLPGNSSDSARSTVSAYIAKSEAGAACELDRVRVIGHSAKATYIEVSCRSGGGYILAGAYPLRPDQPVQSINCSAVPAGRARSNVSSAIRQQLGETRTQYDEAQHHGRAGRCRHGLPVVHDVAGSRIFRARSTSLRLQMAMIPGTNNTARRMNA